jgi:hypothetical protein
VIGSLLDQLREKVPDHYSFVEDYVLAIQLELGKIQQEFIDCDELLRTVFDEKALPVCIAKRSDLVRLSENFEPLKKALDKFIDNNILKYSTRNEVYRALECFDQIYAELLAFETIDKWLRDQKFISDSIVPPRLFDQSSLTFQEMIDRKEQICDAWGFEEGSKVLKILLFFIAKGSRLFEDNFIKFVASQRVDLATVSKDDRKDLLTRLITQTVEALDNLINDEKQTLSSITSSDIKGILR